MSRTRRLVLLWCWPVVAAALGLTLHLTGNYVSNAFTSDGVMIVEQPRFKGVDVPRVTHALTPLASWVDDSPYQPN